MLIKDVILTKKVERILSPQGKAQNLRKCYIRRKRNDIQ